MGRFDLKKVESGERFNFSKSFGLDNIRAELTWNQGDLDVEAWLLNSDGLIVNDAGFVFYNSVNRTEPFDKAKFGNKKNYLEQTRPMSADGSVLGSKDELEGGIETVNIELNKVAPEVQEIVISATVHHPSKEFPNVKVFGDVLDAKITIIDEDTGEALCQYALGTGYPTEDACVVARFINNDEGEWEFEADGKGYSGGLQTLVDIFAEE